MRAWTQFNSVTLNDCLDRDRSAQAGQGGVKAMVATRVLLVENDRHMADGLRRCFQVSGHCEVVHVTSTASGAMRWLDEHPRGWDLALIDIFLDEGHGYAVLKHCRKSGAHQRVVVMSNYARREAVEQALAQGADRFFDKATELDQLVAYCVDQP